MQLNEKLIEALNDLIRINNDRVEGYRKAIDQTEDDDLQALFQRMREESLAFISQLEGILQDGGVEPTHKTTIYGKLYRTWMDVKATFSGHDRHSILAACEYGEDSTQRTYEDVLGSNISMPYSIRELIANQRRALRSAHDTVRTYRDLEKVVH